MNDKPRVMPLNDALTYLKGHKNIVLNYGDAEKPVDLWTPNSAAVPLPLRRAVVKYSNDLEALMHQGDVRVCPNANLHRKSFKYAGNGAWACDICQQLDPEVSKS